MAVGRRYEFSASILRDEERWAEKVARLWRPEQGGTSRGTLAVKIVVAR